MNSVLEQTTNEFINISENTYISVNNIVYIWPYTKEDEKYDVDIIIRKTSSECITLSLKQDIFDSKVKPYLNIIHK